MWYFIGGALFGAAVASIAVIVIKDANKLDRELEEAVRKWTKEFQI